MSKNYQNLFSLMTQPDLPRDLLANVMDQIHRQRQVAKTRNRLIVFSLGLVGSVAAFIPMIKSLIVGLNNSGFFQFFSLLFTDSKTVLAYWDNFLLTLLESLPILSLIAVLAIVLIFLESLKNFFHDLKIILPNHNKIFN
jgi:hypothetical protein